MKKFVYNPEEYSERNFAPIPEGNHSVRVNEVIPKIFSNGKSGFEVKLDVAGYNSKLWHYITIDPEDTKKTNQRLGSFFDSFAIANYDLDNYQSWVGHDGAVRVRHSEYEGRTIAQVAFCLNRKQQSQLFGHWDKPSNNTSNDFKVNMHLPAAPVVPPERFNGFSF